MKHVGVLLFARRAIRSKADRSRALSLTVLLVILIAVLLPFSPLAGILGFVPLPVSYFVFLGAATATYLLLVELVKRRLMKKFV